MKHRDSRHPKSPQSHKHAPSTSIDPTKSKSSLQNNPNPLPIPLQKHKHNSATKIHKADPTLQGKETKRKMPKKNSQELNATLETTTRLLPNALPKENKQESISACKKKNVKKDRKTTKGKNFGWNQMELKRSILESDRSTKKSDVTLGLKEQEYLFVGSEIFPVEKLCATKRLLDTFREVCSGQEGNKFVTQDKTEKPRQKMDLLRKSNIFSATRKELEAKKQVKSAIKIQKWWRRVSKGQSGGADQILEAETERRVDCLAEMDCQTPQKATLASPFEVSPNITHNSPRSPLSIHPAETVEYRPKKVDINFEEQDSMPTYRLPQVQQSNPVDNEDIFSHKYAAQIYPEEESQDSMSNSQPHFSPIKSKENIDNFPAQVPKPMSIFEEYEEAARVKEAIDMRIAVQKGILRQQETHAHKVGISTSTLSIHNFLVRFFQFYIDRHRGEFISLINMPVGFSICARLRALQGLPLPSEPQQDEEGVVYGVQQIIDSQKLQEYFEYLEKHENGNNNSFIRANNELLHIHSRSILEYFNKELNQFRPYCHINGVPYPWNHSHKALTFYFVTQENIPEVFEKAEIKLLRSTAHLCGLQIPKTPPLPHNSNPLQQTRSHLHPLLLEHEQSRQTKLCHDELKKEDFQADCEWVSGLMMDVGQHVVYKLIEEATIQLRMLSLGIY